MDRFELLKIVEGRFEVFKYVGCGGEDFVMDVVKLWGFWGTWNGLGEA